MKKEIILDASTLILLAKITLLELAAEHLKIIIPETVESEAVAKKELLDARLIGRLIQENKIKVVQVKQALLGKEIQKDFLLGRGEAQALELAGDKNSLLGIDDQQGIKACKVFGIAFTTALAMIVRFHEKGLLKQEQLKSKIEKLRTYGWYRKELLEAVFKEIKGGHPS